MTPGGGSEFPEEPSHRNGAEHRVQKLEFKRGIKGNKNTRREYPPWFQKSGINLLIISIIVSFIRSSISLKIGKYIAIVRIIVAKKKI